MTAPNRPASAPPGATPPAKQEHDAPGERGDGGKGDAGGARLPSWHEANQRYLVAKLAALAERLRPEPGAGEAEVAGAALEAARSAMPAPPALERLASAFALSPFERDVLALCAGVELDASFAARCAAAQGDPRRPQPTFGLALAALPDAHWSALGPASPLRQFHLIELGTGEGLTRSPLHIDERVLHYLVGVEQPDERLAGLLDPVATAGALVPSQQRVAERVASLWAQAPRGGPLPAVTLSGGDARARRDVAAAACAALGLRLDALDTGALAARADGELAGRLLAREAILGGRALLVEVGDAEPIPALRSAPWSRLVERAPGPLVLSAHARLRPERRPAVAFEVPAPDEGEQRALWRAAIAKAGLTAPGVREGPKGGAADVEGPKGEAADVEGPRGEVANELEASGDVGAVVDRLVAQFDLDAPAIEAACVAAATGDPADGLGAALWQACRAETRAALDELAERIEPSATWSDLVLPEPSLRELREIASSLRQRAKVQGAWGFDERGGRGLGTGALFAGPSGTGKTMAAEVLAADLRLDLFRVDLSRLVSKYIGETEKNVRRVFDAAERGAAILLFDEADALFGRRGEVRDGADRYANLEVAYLLQRMESYRGLAILTTNLERSLDPAFVRRLRFVVRFPLPGAAERATLFRRAFPPRVPTEGLDFERLAELVLTGGSIRNVVLRAAYLAAEQDGPVRMAQMLEAARAEYEKLGRTQIPGL
jgi:ATPase family protein associated with various cellular activities (AAA)/winged helix domain-containing protein